MACEARTISDEMFLAAARSLADQVDESDLVSGSLYPPLSSIRALSKAIAVDVAKKAFEQGLAGIEQPTDLDAYIEKFMYQPTYLTNG